MIYFKFRNTLPWLLGSCILFSCAKEAIYNPDGGSTDLESRNSISLEVSYELTNVGVIDPENGNFEDMCIGDIRMLNQLTRIYEVTSTITEQGEACIEVIRNHSKPLASDGGPSSGSGGGRSGFEYVSTSKYCNQILTYTTRDTTTTKSMTINQEFWKKVVEGYLYTETEITETFQTMLDSLETGGAIVVEDDTTISVTETLSFGEQVTSVYSKHNYLLLNTMLTDSSGEVKQSFAYEYACSQEGVIVPKCIFIKSSEISSICKTPFERKEWMMFDNYSVSLN